MIHAILFAAFWIAASSAYAAKTVTVSLAPAYLEVGQNVTVVVSGTRDRTPVAVGNISYVVAGNQVNVFATIFEGGTVAPDTPFSFSVGIGQLPMGAYQLTYTQSYDSGFGILPDSVTNIQFFVAASAIPALNRWALLLLATALAVLTFVHQRKARLQWETKRP